MPLQFWILLTIGVFAGYFMGVMAEQNKRKFPPKSEKTDNLYYKYRK